MPQFLILVPSLLIFLATSNPSRAFIPPPQPKQQRHVNTNISHALKMKGECSARKLASSLVIGAFLSVNTMNVSPAFASTSSTHGNNLEASSSICVSQTITTMDFSLPSSYNKISDAKASATAELTEETNVITNTSRKKASSTAKDRVGGGGNQQTDEEKAQLAEERRAEREALAAEKVAEREALKAEKNAERELLAAQKATEREELALQKAAENQTKLAAQAEKRAAKALAEEAREAKAANERLRGAEFVDFSLPSYEATTDGKKDNAFAI